MVQYDDNTLKSTPFHVRFSKFKLLKPEDKIVSRFLGIPILEEELVLNVNCLAVYQNQRSYDGADNVP